MWLEVGWGVVLGYDVRCDCLHLIVYVSMFTYDCLRLDVYILC